MAQFGEWIKNPARRSNMELFTGYMTSSRFVISMIEYYNSMEEGPKKTQLKAFLDGRIESKLLSSNAVEISKTKENIQAVTDWIEKNQNDANVFKDWISKPGTSLFNEEKFLKSSRKVANLLKGKTAKDMYATLASIKQQILKDPSSYGELTVEAIDDFTTEITNMHTAFKNSSEVANDEGNLSMSFLVSQWLHDGILLRSTRMWNILFDIYTMWMRGEIGSEAAGNLFQYDSKEDFQNMFTDAINSSKFFKKDENGNSMIFIEGKKFTGTTDKGLIGDSYYRDSNPTSNFTVSSDIQTPSVYFKKIDTIDLNAVGSAEEVVAPVETKEEAKKTEPKKEVKEEVKEEEKEKEEVK
jgi:hypothetical protein